LQYLSPWSTKRCKSYDPIDGSFWLFNSKAKSNTAFHSITMSPPKVLALNEKARAQPVTGPAAQETVTVAVLAPRLPPGMGEADGQGVADAISWDANVNSQHNRLLPKGDESLSGKKKFLKKAGMTRDRN
jgi:hypothetical protein